MPLLAKILPYLNAILMVLTEIINSIAALFGYDLGDYDFFGGSIDSAWEFDDALTSAGESASKLKRGLRGFDKLNVITTPTSSGTSGGVSGGIDPKLLSAFDDAFDSYNEKLANVQMKATKIRDSIMEWLGFTKEVDEETGKVSFKFDHITGGTVLGALVVGGAIYKGISGIFKVLNKIGLIKFSSLSEIINFFKDGTILSSASKLGGAFDSLASTLGISVGTLGIITGAIIAVGGAFIYAYTHSEDFRNKVNDAISSVSKVLKTLTGVVSKVFKEIWEIIEPIWNTIKTTLVSGLNIIYQVFEGTFENIAIVIKGAFDFIDKIIHGDFSGAFDSLKNMVIDLWKNWNEHSEKIKEIFRNLASNIWDNITEFVPKAIEKMEEILDWIIELPNKFFYWAGQAVGTIWKVITETNWLELGSKILNGIVSGVLNIGSAFWNFGTSLFNKLREAISNINWFSIGSSVLDGIKNGLMSFGSKLGSWGKSFVQGIKDALGIHSPARLIIDAKIGNFIFDGITEGMEDELPTLKIQAENISDTLNDEMKKIKPIKVGYEYEPFEMSDSLNLDSNLENSDVSTIFQKDYLKNNNSSKQPQVFNIYLDPNHKIGTYTLEQLQDLADANGKPITIGG